MQISVIGLFGSYAQAETAVLDLERAGIVGESVEVISDPERDARAPALGMKATTSVRDRIARVFGPSTRVYDVPGDMPDYIGDQDFYATHVHHEGAILIVSVSSPKLASAAENILTENGSQTRDGKKGVLTREIDDRPHSARRASA